MARTAADLHDVLAILSGGEGEGTTFWLSAVKDSDSILKFTSDLQPISTGKILPIK